MRVSQIILLLIMLSFIYSRMEDKRAFIALWIVFGVTVVAFVVTTLVLF